MLKVCNDLFFVLFCVPFYEMNKLICKKIPFWKPSDKPNTKKLTYNVKMGDPKMKGAPPTILEFEIFA